MEFPLLKHVIERRTARLCNVNEHVVHKDCDCLVGDAAGHRSFRRHERPVPQRQTTINHIVQQWVRRQVWARGSGAAKVRPRSG